MTGVCDDNGSRREFSAPLSIHVLGHVSGFVCLRPTLRFDQVPGGVDDALIRHLKLGLWDGALGLQFRIEGVDEPLVGNVRTLLNWVFLDLITRWAGTPAEVGDLHRWAREGRFGCERLHELVRQRRLDYPYPVSLGIQIEIADRRLADSTAGADLAARIAHDLLRGPEPGWDVEPVDIERDCRNVWWYMEESEALTLSPPRDIDAALDVIDADRTQLLEFLAIRRAALESVQRETQRILADGSKISRVRVNSWYRLVTVTTDDYVLHRRVGWLTAPLRRHGAEDRRLRDLAELEDQVRSNLESFQGRLQATGAFVSSLLGALVGAGALVIGLDLVTRNLMARVLDVPLDKLPARYPFLLSSVTLTLLVLTFLVAYMLIRRASASLGTRFEVRRGPLRRARGSLLASRGGVRGRRLPGR